MKISNILATLLLTLVGSNSFAQGVFDRGNGGGGILCNDQTIEVLDIRDMNQFGFQVDPNVPSDFNETVDFIFARFAESNDQIAFENLQTEWHAYLAEVEFVKKPLKNIDDFGIKPNLPPGCKFVQLAIQWNEISFWGSHSIISEPMWTQLNQTHQAALIFHEVFYRYSLKHYKKFAATPVVVRRTVGYYFSAQYLAPKNPPYRFHYKK